MESKPLMKYKPTGVVVLYSEKLYATGNYVKWEPAGAKAPVDPVTPADVDEVVAKPKGRPRKVQE